GPPFRGAAPPGVPAAVADDQFAYGQVLLDGQVHQRPAEAYRAAELLVRAEQVHRELLVQLERVDRYAGTGGQLGQFRGDAEGIVEGLAAGDRLLVGP